jgi:hypothetical protein
MGIDSHLSTCVGTQSPKYLEMAQGHISLSPTRRAKIVRPTVGAVDRWRSRPLAHRTVRWTTGQPGEFYPYVVELFPESDDFATDDSLDSPVLHRTVRWIIAVRRRRVPKVACSPRLILAHRTLSSAPPDSPVHLDRAGDSFPIAFLLFLALRHNTLVPKSMY